MLASVSGPCCFGILTVSQARPNEYMLATTTIRDIAGAHAPPQFFSGTPLGHNKIRRKS
jgi:hypothetical protein